LPSENEAISASDPFAGVDAMQGAIIRKAIENDSLRSTKGSKGKIYLK